MSYETKPSEMVSLTEYYGETQNGVKCRQINDIAFEDRVEIHYPRTWLDKLDYIDRVHQDGAKSDKEIVEHYKKKEAQSKYVDQQG